MTGIILWDVVPLTALCSLHLCLGIGIGCVTLHFQGGQKRKARRRPVAVSRKGIHDGAIDEVLRQALQLSAICREQTTPVAESLAKAIAEIVQATTVLKEQMGGRQLLIPGKQSPPHSQLKPSPGYDLSGGELSALVSDCESNEIAMPNAVVSERRQYRVKQWVAKCSSSGLPAVEDFQPVLCNEISVGGMSFYCDHVQVDQQVVMSLGQGVERLFVLAEVKNRRVAQLEGEPVYLVGCRFLRRLSHEADAERIASYQALFNKQAVLT